MSDLRKMLEDFKNNYVYIQADMQSPFIRRDNDSIYKILSGMMDRIEAIERQNNRAKIVEEKK